MRGFIAQSLAVSRISLAGVRARPGSSLVIVVGMLCVTGVLVSMLSFATGLAHAFEASADPGLALVMSSQQPHEFGSSLSRSMLGTILDAPGIAKGPDGKALASAEYLFQVPPAEGFAEGSLSVHGVGAAGLDLRSRFHMLSGRRFLPGRQEMIVGAGAANVYHLKEGDTISMPDGDWPIVGTFSTEGSLLESDLVADVDTLLASARISGFGSVLVRLANPSDLESTKRWLAANPSLGVVCERQSDYYLRQSSGSTAFLVTIAWLCGGIMALGALFGSVKILYSVVGARTTEIATLRAVGYDASSVAASVVVEGLVLSLTGAALGACLAWLLFDGRQVMRDWIFHLFVPFRLIALGLGWAVLISLLGSVFPAMRAARLPVAQALRAT